jgi:hypothetical protein
MALCLLAVTVLNVVVVTHTAGAAYPRLLMAAAAAGRVVVLWLLAIALLSGTREDRAVAATA